MDDLACRMWMLMHMVLLGLVVCFIEACALQCVQRADALISNLFGALLE